MLLCCVCRNGNDGNIAQAGGVVLPSAAPPPMPRQHKPAAAGHAVDFASATGGPDEATLAQKLKETEAELQRLGLE